MGTTRWVAAVLVAGFCSVTGSIQAQPFEPQPEWKEPEGLFGEFGRGVAGGGDVNGDGYDDVLVSGPFHYAGGPPSTNQEGAVLAYHGSAAGLEGFYVWFEVGLFPGTTLGSDLSFAGDVNNDGYDDVLFASGSGFGMGWHQVHVRFGSPSGLSAVWDFNTFQTFDTLGPAATGGGDVNGDGYADIAAGFPREDAERGVLRIFHGSAAGLPAVPSLELTGEAEQRFAGNVSFAGDVQGDGFDDLLVCDETRSGLDPEYVELYSGSATGLDGSASWSLVQPEGFRCNELTENLSRAGDINGDGFDDVLLGAYRLDHDGGEGAVHLYLGSAQGLPATPDQTLFGDGSFGEDLAPLGDINGDGFDDVLIGAPQEIVEGQDERGAGYVFLGSVTGLQPQPVWRSGTVPDTVLLGDAVSTAGDVDGDGAIDLLLGDPGSDGAFLFAGREFRSAGPSGAVSGSGSAGLEVSRLPGDLLELRWPGSCLGSSEDFAVHAGTLGDYASHQPLVCTTGGSTSWQIEAGAANRYFLIVSRSLDAEGSYGLASDGQERAAASSPCLPQQVTACP